jgi:hypothetical protein
VLIDSLTPNVPMNSLTPAGEYILRLQTLVLCQLALGLLRSNYHGKTGARIDSVAVAESVP